MAELAYGEVYTMNPVEARRPLIKTYHETQSISETARIWRTSRRVVRKWVGRFQVEGETGLKGRSRRPYRSPRQTPPEVERLVIEARKATGYGRERLSLYLKREGLDISPDRLHHILRRHGLTKRGKRRKPLYPPLWAWEVEKPFSLIQTDMKDILDKRSFAPTLWDHLRKHKLPRYQTCCVPTLARG